MSRIFTLIGELRIWRLSADEERRNVVSALLKMATVLAALLLGLLATPASAYSVLSHEAIVDGAWAKQIEPMLRKRFPEATTEDLRRARAYAYGGSIIQDLGYYPFGSQLSAIFCTMSGAATSLPS